MAIYFLIANTIPTMKRREEIVADEMNNKKAIEQIDRLIAENADNHDEKRQEPAIHCLTIIGQVEGHVQLPPQTKTTKYEQIIPHLVAIEQDPAVKGLLVLLNTVGGDVEAGLAIAEMIASLSKPTVSIVLGGGHSIGIPIAVSCDWTYMVPSATMTIHPIRLTGMIIGVPQTFEYLEKMQDRVVNFIVDHSKISEDALKELMFAQGNLSRDIGTNIVGEEAIGTGLVDSIGGVSEAIAKLNELMVTKKM